MGHGGYGKRKTAAAERKKPAGQRRPKTLAVDKKSKANKPKQVSIKNQIRSTERMLRKDLPPEVKEVQEKKLEELKKQQEIHNRLAVERQIFLRDRKIKFFERRKIERRLRRLEKQQRASSGQAQEGEIANQVSQLKEDLEYVRFFPKTEKYVSLFMGGDETEIVDKRNTLRKQIKTNLVAAAASGKDLEETGSEDDGLLDASDDDFFLHGSSSDEADADDELTDKSAREQASSASGKATSGMSSDERNQRQISARALMPPPGPSRKQFQSSLNNKSGFAGSSGKKSYNRADKSTSSNTSSSIDRSSFRKRGPVDSTTGNSGSLSSNSDARNTSSSIDRTSFRKRGPVDSTTGNSGSWSFNSGARKRGPVDSTTGNSGSRSFSSGTRTRGPVDSTTGTSSSHSFNSGTRTRGPVDSITGNSGNLSSNSDARKPRRKRRPKKKMQ